MNTKEELEMIVVKKLYLEGYTNDRIKTNLVVKGIGEFDIIVVLQKPRIMKKGEILAIECKHWSSGSFPLPEYLKFTAKCDLLSQKWNVVVYRGVVATVPPSKDLKILLNELKSKYHGYWYVGSNEEYSWENSGFPQLLRNYRRKQYCSLDYFISQQ